MNTRNASRSELAERVFIAALEQLPSDAPACIAGRVVDVHATGLTLQDETGGVAVDCNAPPAPGTLCQIAGRWRGGVVHAEHLEPLGGSERVFRADSDYRRLSAGGGPVARLRQRARLVHAVRAFFEARDYLEVETPLAVPSPGLDLHLRAFEVHTGAERRFLITSPEYQMKRLLSAGAERIFQVARCFRRDEAGRLHEAEFSMLEWYRAYSTMAQMLEETEALVRTVAGAATGPHAPPVLRREGARIDVSAPFERLTVREAFERYADASADELAKDEERFYRVLVEQIEPQLGQERPTFLTHYPASMASLARLSPEDPSVAERFELYVAGVELCNGFGELTCPDEQRARLEADRETRRNQGLDDYPIDERFLAALEDGVPPSAGNALGLDRLFMLALGLQDIQALQAVPGAVL